MKTRIEIRTNTLNSGAVVFEYYPQYKGRLFWKYFEDCGKPVKKDTLQRCKDFIDFQLACEGGQVKTTTSEYIKYP